nr:uncharacterized protein LOC117456286 [Pseudochaenichthys georgianus]
MQSLFLAEVESYPMVVRLCKQYIDPGQQLSHNRTSRSGPIAQHCQQLDVLLIPDRMSTYFTLWVFLGMLSPFLLAEGADHCSEREGLVRLLPRRPLSNCLTECTQMTYHKKLQLEDNHNIRLSYCTEGDPGEYCWSTQLKCNIGESFVQAYVVLPVDVSVAGHEMLEVRATVPSATPLLRHNSPTTIADDCGLQYDVAPQFSTENTGNSFCIQVVSPVDSPVDFLKCPPFLVTFWERKSNQINQGGDG